MPRDPDSVPTIQRSKGKVRTIPAALDLGLAKKQEAKRAKEVEAAVVKEADVARAKVAAVCAPNAPPLASVDEFVTQQPAYVIEPRNIRSEGSIPDQVMECAGVGSVPQQVIVTSLGKGADSCPEALYPAVYALLLETKLVAAVKPQHASLDCDKSSSNSAIIPDALAAPAPIAMEMKPNTNSSGNNASNTEDGEGDSTVPKPEPATKKESTDSTVDPVGDAVGQQEDSAPKEVQVGVGNGTVAPVDDTMGQQGTALIENQASEAAAPKDKSTTGTAGPVGDTKEGGDTDNEVGDGRGGNAESSTAAPRREDSLAINKNIVKATAAPTASKLRRRTCMCKKGKCSKCNNCTKKSCPIRPCACAGGENRAAENDKSGGSITIAGGVSRESAAGKNLKVDTNGDVDIAAPPSPSQSEEEDDAFLEMKFEDDRETKVPLWQFMSPEEMDNVLFEEDVEMPEWKEVPWPLPLVQDVPLELALALVPQALGIYSTLFTFMRVIRIYPFYPEPFMSALAVDHPIILLDDIHIGLLKFLMMSDHAGMSGSMGTTYPNEERENPTALKLFNLKTPTNSYVLDVLTWPTFVINRIEKAYERSQQDPSQLMRDFAPEDQSGNIYTAAFEGAKQLKVKNYHSIAPKHKLAILDFLVAELMDTDAIIAELDSRLEERQYGESRRKVVADCAKPHPEDTDPNTDYCWLCALGGNLACCDFCSASYHTKCIGETMSSLPDPWHCPECSYRGAFRNALRSVTFTFGDTRYCVQHGYLLSCRSTDRSANFKVVNQFEINAMMLTLSKSCEAGDAVDITDVDQLDAGKVEVRQMSRMFKILYRSMQNKFIRQFEKIGTTWLPRETPLQTAMCYVNKFEKAPFPIDSNVSAVSLGFIGGGKDAENSSFLTNKLETRRRCRSNAQKSELQINRKQLMSMNTNAFPPRTSTKTPLEDIQLEMLRDGITGLESVLRGVAINLPKDWCYDMWLHDAQQASTVEDVRTCLLQLEAVLDTRSFKHSWAGRKKVQSFHTVVLTKNKKRKRASVAPAASVAVEDGDTGKGSVKKKYKKRKSDVAMDEPEYAICERWMYSIESLRILDVKQGEQIKAIVQTVIQETGNERVVKDLQELMMAKKRPEMTCADPTVDMAELYVVRKIRDGALHLLDTNLNTIALSCDTSPCKLPLQFSNRDWLIADIKEVSPCLGELIPKQYFYHRKTRETKWFLHYDKDAVKAEKDKEEVPKASKLAADAAAAVSDNGDRGRTRSRQVKKEKVKKEKKEKNTSPKQKQLASSVSDDTVASAAATAASDKEVAAATPGTPAPSTTAAALDTTAPVVPETTATAASEDAVPVEVSDLKPEGGATPNKPTEAAVLLLVDESATIKDEGATVIANTDISEGGSMPSPAKPDVAPTTLADSTMAANGADDGNGSDGGATAGVSINATVEDPKIGAIEDTYQQQDPSETAAGRGSGRGGGGRGRGKRGRPPKNGHTAVAALAVKKEKKEKKTVVKKPRPSKGEKRETPQRQRSQRVRTSVASYAEKTMAAEVASKGKNPGTDSDDSEEEFYNIINDFRGTDSAGGTPEPTQLTKSASKGRGRGRGRRLAEEAVPDHNHSFFAAERIHQVKPKA
jgi:hypothetical protein